jgi:TetR/AcrR family fatty acid metabolism transcriptional regulator
MAKTPNPALQQQRRVMIMLTVAQLLTEGSHSGVTLDRIAKAAGVSKGMLTYYFDSKDQLFTDTIAFFLEQQELALRTILEDDGAPPMDRLRRLIATALPDGDTVQLHLRFLVEVWSYAKERPEAMKMVRESHLRFRQQCEQLIDLGAAKGYVTARDRKWVNLLLHAILDGMSFQLAIDDELDVPDVRERLLALIDGMLAPTDSARP